MSCSHGVDRHRRVIRFNGQASGKFAPQFAAQGYRTVVLPFERKLEMRRRLVDT